MNNQILNETVEKFIADKKIACGILSVRKNDRIVFQNKWGYSDLEKNIEIQYDDVFRMMSMTKPVTAVSVLKLVEQGKINPDDPVSKFIPEFSDMRVIDDRRFEYKEKTNPLKLAVNLMLFNHIKPKTVPAQRDVTIRDLLTHTSGLEQGVWGYMALIRKREPRETPEDVAMKYSRYYLDWQPGTQTSYSALAGFDVLVRIIEVVSGMNASEYFDKEVFKPLGMNTTGFFEKDFSGRIVKLYKCKKNGLKDVTGSRADTKKFIKCGDGYVCGSGGLYSTLEDYEKFVRMLCNNGIADGERFLQSDTVELLHTEGAAVHLEPEPGMVWGFGVRIRQDGKKGNFNATPGTYGWSGAFGTHFFISPKDNLEAVWLTNISNSGGSSSIISKEIEKLVFSEFTGGTDETV